MPFSKTPGPIRILSRVIKLRPFTLVKLAKRLEPLPGLSQLILQVYGPKELVVQIGSKKDYQNGIGLLGGDPLPFEADELIFKELHLYADINSSVYRIDFELKGKEFRKEIKRWEEEQAEAKKTIWIHLAVMQLAKL